VTLPSGVRDTPNNNALAAHLERARRAMTLSTSLRYAANKLDRSSLSTVSLANSKRLQLEALDKIESVVAQLKAELA